MDGFFCRIRRTFGRMSITERFVQHLHEQVRHPSRVRFLLTVSGGKDSVMMVHLFATSGYAFGIAHGNFGLRGAASDADEALVTALAESLDVPFFVTRFDTEPYARQHGISVQMAARELRYTWFEHLRVTQGYDYIAVAQHRNDHVETLLLNLVRGTGLAGLQGIKPKRDRILRPMLFLSTEEIVGYVQKYQLEYRDDASNFSTKYARNKIRLEVIPTLKELNPNLEATLAKNMALFSDAYRVVQMHTEQLRAQLFVEHRAGEWHIPVSGLKALHPQLFLLYALFEPYGFTEAVLNDLAGSWRGTPGKRFESPSHVLYLDRTEVVLLPQPSAYDEVATLEKAGDRVKWGEYHFESLGTTATPINTEAHVAQFDADRLVFPLSIRAWKRGDVFRPLGMEGQKKLSDLFVSLKIPVYRKHTVPVVTNGNGDIVWVAPYRMDDRYKITAKTKKVITLVCF